MPTEGTASRRRLSVTLRSSVVYVTGTVNGVPTTWTRGDGDVWSTTADRAQDDVYRVVLTMIDGAGRTFDAAVTLYYGLLQLITDRTQADVDTVRRLAAKGWDAMTADEREAWTAGLKGAYNTTDLERVANATVYVADRLKAAGYICDVSPKLVWTADEMPVSETTIPLYLSQVAVVRSVLADAIPGLPELPEDLERLTYEEANDIERVLLMVNDTLDRIRDGGYYAGEIYAAET